MDKDAFCDPALQAAAASVKETLGGRAAALAAVDNDIAVLQRELNAAGAFYRVSIDVPKAGKLTWEPISEKVTSGPWIIALTNSSGVSGLAMCIPGVRLRCASLLPKLLELVAASVRGHEKRDTGT